MKDADYFYQEGLENNLNAKFPEAVADYSRAIAIDPACVDAYLKRGTLYYKILKKYKDALSDFNRVVELDKECAYAYLHRGIVKCHLLKFADSLTDFDWAIRLDPNDERAFYNRGKSKYMLRYQKDEVCADLEMAVKLGSVPAADMIELFYGKDEHIVREAISQGIKKKTGM